MGVEPPVNRIAIFGLVLLVLLGMTVAASTGVFLATSSETIAGNVAEAEELGGASLALLPEEEAELADLGDGVAVGPEAKMLTRSAAEDEESAVKLQEVRDAYISFPQAFPEVVVQYQNGPQCDGKPACVVAEDEILINRVWAKSAPRVKLDVVLARQHATLAIDRAWTNLRVAKADMESVIPSCVVEQDSKMYAAATNTASPDLSGTDSLTLVALSDVIVSVMTDEKDAASIYPPQFHTPEQVKVAELVSVGERPEIVVPVSSAVCEN